MNFKADESKVKVIGRTLVRDGIRYINYSCSAIEFVFTGKKVEAILWSDSPAFEDIHKAWVAVFINDEEQPYKRFPLEKSEDVYLLYEGEQVAETKVRLVKYSESYFGRVGIKSIITDCDQPPVPTPYKERRLEFIGDSITCGYGNEGVWNVDTFNTAEENPWDAYAAITARALDADYHLISRSGIGIISNYTELEVPNHDEWFMPEIYPYTDIAMEHSQGKSEYELWDHSRFVPDCIVINLGTNDNSYTKGIRERVETFGEKYYEFVKEVRTRNPRSFLLCTLGAMGQELYGEIEKQVKRLKKEGDSNVDSMPFDLQLEEDGIGADWHPSKITHEKMAIKLERKIRKLMNW